MTEDRSHLPNGERFAAIEADLSGINRVLKTNSGTLRSVGKEVKGLAMIVQSHTLIPPEDAAHLAVLRQQLPATVVTRLGIICDRLEAQWTSQDQADAARVVREIHQWETMKQLLQILLGGMVGVAVVVIGLALQAQHVISIPALLVIVIVGVLAGFAVYWLVAKKAQQVAAHNVPPKGGKQP